MVDVVMRVAVGVVVAAALVVACGLVAVLARKAARWVVAVWCRDGALVALESIVYRVAIVDTIAFCGACATRYFAQLSQVLQVEPVAAAAVDRTFVVMVGLWIAHYGLIAMTSRRARRDAATRADEGLPDGPVPASVDPANADDSPAGSAAPASAAPNFVLVASVLALAFAALFWWRVLHPPQPWNLRIHAGHRAGGGMVEAWQCALAAGSMTAFAVWGVVWCVRHRRPAPLPGAP